MAKVNFLNKAKSFMSENYISQLSGNEHQNERYFDQGVMKRKIQENI